MSEIGLKVFAATRARERELLGEAITEWIRFHPEYQIFDKIVTQSSDAEFHCLAITVFYRLRSEALPEFSNEGARALGREKRR